MITTLLAWFDDNGRPLPWRSSTAWGVLVSEFMLQQTPVDRVLPIWQTWLDRWPTPPDLAQASLADVLRAWGRLGYPRRARRLHETSAVISEQHGGQVPDDRDALLALPGVGDYTAAAILAFAFRRRSIVLDTNVRRVVARTLDGVAMPLAHVTRAERERAERLWPLPDRRSAHWSAAVMEFGALVCTSRNPRCSACPISADCSWTLHGRPPETSPRRRQPEYVGSDRQARGHVLHLLRESEAPVHPHVIELAWPDRHQARRAMDSLVADGLARRLPGGLLALPEADVS
jgi:A/G-specific adenine glycosylase